MPAIPDFRINPYVTTPTPGLSPEFSQTVNQRISQYDANAEFSDVLADHNEALIQQIAPFENDVNYANQIMNSTRQSIDEMAKQGDYENMTRQVKKAARQFSQQAAPLLENQKRYSTYLNEVQSLYQEGKIGIDTLNKAKAYSTAGYNGIDPNNPQNSLFSGFTPSADISVADKVNKFLDEWKADGGSRIIMGEDGSYLERKWESANEKEIAAAIDEYLAGDSDFRNYYQTQATIGNQARVEQEASAAKVANIRKHGFYKEDPKLGWVPEYYHKLKILTDFGNLPATPSPATINPQAQNVFDANGMTQDEATGKIVISDKYEKVNGKYYKFVDGNGNPVSKEDYAVARSMSAPYSNGSAPANLGYKRIEVPDDEIERNSVAGSTVLTDMAADRFLQQQIEKGNISLEGYLGDSKLTEAYLKRTQHIYTTPQYLKDTKKEYDEKIKNSAVIYDNKKWNIAAIPGTTTPEFTSIKDEDLLANLNGEEVGILSADPELGGYTRDQRADLNAMLDKISEETGYQQKVVRRIGPLQYNPFSSKNKPGMEYSLVLEHPETKATKVINFAASIDDSELQPVQDIYSLGYKGMSGVVDFKGLRSIKGIVNGQFRIRTGTRMEGGKPKFASFVEVLGPQGQKIKDKDVPQDIPLEYFGDVYKNFFAPNLVKKYVNPKLLK